MGACRQLRVLLSAYQCGPNMGSVSQIGWEWYSRLARKARVTLVTHVRNRKALEAAGAPLAGSDVIYIDTEWFAGPLYRMASRLFPKSQHSVFLLSSLDFFVHDRYALRELQRRETAGISWDVVHAVTPVSPVAPTVLHRLHAPLVLGPLNGGVRNPPHFDSIMRQDSAWLYRLRNLGRIIDTIVASTRNARVILTATKATRESIPAPHRSKCISMLENGVDLEWFRSCPWPAAPRTLGVLKVAFVGRLIPAKALPLLFRAARTVAATHPIHITVVGDGPMLDEWKNEARSLGLEQAILFTGARPIQEIASAMAEAHVFCLPSVRESGGAVLLEAMAVARPVIAVAYGGPAEIVDDAVGRSIAPDGPDAVERQIAAALQDVIERPKEWEQRGLEGRRRAERLYCWDSKIDQAIDIYAGMAERRNAA